MNHWYVNILANLGWEKIFCWTRYKLHSLFAMTVSQIDWLPLRLVTDVAVKPLLTQALTVSVIREW